MPRTTPRRDTDMFACARPSACPTDAANSAPRNHSWSEPRSSRWTTGVCTQAPSMPSASKTSDRRTDDCFGSVLLALRVISEEDPALERPEAEHHRHTDTDDVAPDVARK